MSKTCPVCKGKGKLHTPLPLPAIVTCLTCRGTGSVEDTATAEKVPFLFKLLLWLRSLFQGKERDKQRDVE